MPASSRRVRDLMAEPGFPRMSGIRRLNSNDRSAAGRSAKWLTADDPKPPYVNSDRDTHT